MEKSTPEKYPLYFQVLHTVVKNAMCTNKVSFFEKNLNVRQNLKTSRTE